MATLANDTQLTLAPGTRLQYEKAQEQWVLLYPEGMVKLNEQAAAILQHCAQATTLGQINIQLKEEYEGDTLEKDVAAFVSGLVSGGMLRVQSS